MAYLYRMLTFRVSDQTSIFFYLTTNFLFGTLIIQQRYNALKWTVLTHLRTLIDILQKMFRINVLEAKEYSIRRPSIFFESVRFSSTEPNLHIFELYFFRLILIINRV